MDKFLAKANVAKNDLNTSATAESTDKSRKSLAVVLNRLESSSTECMLLSDDENIENKSEQAPEPKTPGQNSVKTKSSTQSGRKKEEEENIRREKRLKQEEERMQKKAEEEKRRQERLKLEEERKQKKAEEEKKAEERRQERLKLEEERKKKKAEEEERKAENRRKIEELRCKREEEKLKKEEERIRQMEEKLKREEDAERQKQEKERMKNEEKRLREEEKQREEEEKRRKADLVKNQFAKFFIKIDTPKTSEAEKEEQKNQRFMSFQLKENMSLAPRTRRDDIINYKEFVKNLDECLAESNELPSNMAPNYLKEIRQNCSLIRKQKTNCRKKIKLVALAKFLSAEMISEEASQMSVEEIKSTLDPDETETLQLTNNQVKMKAKYFHFDPKQYRRPPYYGTWRKRSKFIRPRKPFGMDEKLIDYEVNSDDEWEDIVDGESIADSVKGDEEDEKLGDDEEDDGFFVPHGHLSDDEIDDEDERMMDPETKKLREAAKTEQWETERKKSSKFIVPKCYFVNEYWNLPDPKLDCAKDLKHLKHLERLQIMPFLKDFSESLFPMVIMTDEKIEYDKQMKQQADEANKKVKQAANLEANNNSPNSTTKTKLKKKNSDNNQSTLSPLVTCSSTASVTQNTNTTSILKFVSKMSNKNVIARTEQVNDNDVSIVIDTKPPLPHNKIENSPSLNKNALSKAASMAETNTPTHKRQTPIKSNSLLNNSCAQTTPVSSPKVNTSTTAEKRANSSNCETSVKRMKLDELQTKSTEKSVTPTIVSLFKNSTGCRKNLQLNSGKDNENQDSPKSSLIKKHNILGAGSKRDSIDISTESVIKGDIITEAEKMDTEILQDKENECIILD